VPMNSFTRLHVPKKLMGHLYPVRLLQDHRRCTTIAATSRSQVPPGSAAKPALVAVLRVLDAALPADDPG
jgi:hypothetical protein